MGGCVDSRRRDARVIEPAVMRPLFGLTPTRYLTLANIVSAGFGFLSGVYQARVLGPEQLGVMAVIAGLTTSTVTLMDVRLNDVAAKAFYQVNDLAPEAVPAYRAGVLWLAFAGALLVAGTSALLASLFGNFLVPLFTSARTETWWLPVDALSLALTTTSGAMFYLLRFSREFYSIGNWRVITQLLNVLITLLVLTALPNLTGAYLAGLVNGSVSLSLILAVSWRLWSRRAVLPLTRPDWRSAYVVYRQSLNMIFYGNLLGYSKLLQRALDVLVVAYFTNDRETGLYKLARQVVDNGLAILQDALYQVYFPNFLELFARRAAQAFRALALRLLVISTLITVALLAGEVLLLPLLIPLLFGLQFSGAEWPMMILTSTFVFIVGFYTWLWAIFTGSGQLRGYTALTFLSALVQYGVMLSLFARIGPFAWAAMLGMLAYYLFLMPGAYGLAHRRWRAYLPGAPRISEAAPA
jgi:O-antigen/teichoic acid export membrane protein